MKISNIFEAFEKALAEEKSKALKKLLDSVNNDWSKIKLLG